MPRALDVRRRLAALGERESVCVCVCVRERDSYSGTGGIVTKIVLPRPVYHTLLALARGQNKVTFFSLPFSFSLSLSLSLSFC